MNNIKSILLLFILLLSTITASAADSLAAVRFSIQPGETKTLALRLTNKTKYRAFQTEITLPNGLSFIKKDDGTADVSLTNRAPSSFVINSVFKSQQTLRIVSYSNDNAVIKGDTGTIVGIKVKAGDSFLEGNVDVKNTIFTTETNQDSKLEDTKSEVYAKTLLIAKVNDVSKEYGEENPKFTFSYEGFRNGDTESSLERIPETFTNATKTSDSGIYGISANYGKSDRYIFKYQSGYLTIKLAQLTASAGNYTMKQGDAMPEFKPSYEGFKNDDDESALKEKPNITTEATSTSAPGVYTVNISGGFARNYDINYKPGTLTIIAAEGVAVTAKSYTRVYGDDNPNFEYSAEGAELDGTPEITCEANKNSPVGTYPIVIKHGSIKNYNVSYVNGTLTITKAPLIISVDNYTKKQGEPMPEFKATYDGFKNGENEDVLTAKPQFSTEANEASAPGQYSINADGAAADNYDITYKAGTLTIIPADGVAVTAKSYTRVYGDDNPNFEYSAEGAALDGTPEITCEATKSSPVGTYPIVIKHGSIKNYNVSYVNGTLTITKAPLTISVGNYTKKQGEPMPEFKATYDGFKNGENENVLIAKPSITTDANEASAPGQYSINADGAAADNYDITYKAGTLTVIPADGVAVTAKSYTRVYGDDNPNLEYSAEGAALDGTPEITCEATKNSPVGTYPIVIKQGSIKNYNVSYVNGTLTITKAPLTISVGNYTKKQGEPMPEFKATYDGFKNGENEDVLTAKPQFSTEANEASAPGQYSINADGAAADNYDITYKAGTLTVIDADGVAVTAKSYTRVYGDDNPNFEYSAEGAELDGTPEITCEATKNSPVGTYPIVIKQGSIKNYNVSYVNGTLTITKAPLTISVGNYTKKQGEPMPEFKASYDGFKNGENEDVLTAKPQYSTEANEQSPSGEYEIKVNGAEAQNYDISYVNGKLTIIQSKVDAPVISTDNDMLTITCATDGATIYYTLDGTEPKEDSRVYTEPISLSASCLINAFAKKEGLDNSDAVTSEYHNAQYPDIVKVGDVFPAHLICNNLQTLAQYFEVTSMYPFEVKIRRKLDFEPDWDRSSVSGDVEVPAEIEHNGVRYSITELGDQCFSYFYKMTSIKLNEGLKKIDGEALRYTGIKEIVIPNSVVFLSGANFTECHNLETVVLGSGLQTIGGLAFWACWSKFKTLYSLNPEPPIFVQPDLSFVFEDNESLPDDFVLYVPTGSKVAYETSPGWDKLVGHIAEFDPTAINDITIDKVTSNSYWYTLSGVRLAKKPVKEGIYIHGGMKIIIKGK